MPQKHVSPQVISKQGELNLDDRLSKLLKADESFFRAYDVAEETRYHQTVETGVLTPSKLSVKKVTLNPVILMNGIDDRFLEFKDVNGTTGDARSNIGNCHAGDCIIMKCENPDDVVGTSHLRLCDSVGGSFKKGDDTYLYMYHNHGANKNQDILEFHKWLHASLGKTSDWKIATSTVRDLDEKDSNNFDSGSRREGSSLRDVLGQMEEFMKPKSITCFERKEGEGSLSNMTVSQGGTVVRQGDPDPKKMPKFEVDWMKAKVMYKQF